MRLQVGVDLVAVADVEEAVRVHADRYLTRIFSPRELGDCLDAAPAVAAERLAARFAAKEAAMKVLRSTGENGDEPMPWNAIEVVRSASGAPELMFSGRAAELARAAGVTDVAVSFTHEHAYAAAVVIAQSEAA
jgi:holo-[acyl-carrier protein] synthase